jgi:hypothetical protein
MGTLTVRFFLVPEKSLPLLNQDILNQIFESLLDDFENDTWSMHRAVTILCLTCQEWRQVARFYLPIKLFETSHVYPHLTEEIDFIKKKLKFLDTSSTNFSTKAWIKGGKHFLDVFSHIRPGTSMLGRVHFDDCFNTFQPSEWSQSLHRCSRLDIFSFSGRTCAWENIKNFLVEFQTSTNITLMQVSLDAITVFGRNDLDVINASEANQILHLLSLTLERVSFSSILSDILPVVISDLVGIRFYRTCLNILCARQLFQFLSSPISAGLEYVTYSLMPPQLDESSQPDHSLIWPHTHTFQTIVSTPTLRNLDIDGGIFGGMIVTAHHIAHFSRIVTLESLELNYCFNDVRPMALQSLADSSLWPSLCRFTITFEFNDPNWGREDIDQLIQHLRATMDLDIEENSDYIFIDIAARDVEERCFNLLLHEGGNTFDN